MSEPYLLGTTLEDAVSMVIKDNHELHRLVTELQQRVLELEMQIRCDHFLKPVESGIESQIPCGVIKNIGIDMAEPGTDKTVYDPLNCAHEFKKVLAESGMFYFMVCSHCKESRPWNYLDE